MNSRLDRLFILLDTGSNEAIRLAAAKQIGEVQRVQPDDLNYLLGRIKEYSSKSVWEARVAAGHAIRCVLEQVESWPSNTTDNEDEFKSGSDTAEGFVKSQSFESIIQEFDLDKIIATCPKLLSLDNIDTDEPSEAPTASTSRGSTRGRGSRGSSSRRNSRVEAKLKVDKERQRKLINKELGIGMVDSLNLGVKSTDIVSNDDLDVDFESNDNTNSKSSKLPQADTKTIIENAISNYEKCIKALCEANCLPSATNESTVTKTIQSSIGDKSTSLSRTASSWPLTDITRQYTEEIFNPSWEIRHGAAIALREIVRLHGKYAGKIWGIPDKVNEILNHCWLVDMALKAICVLSLDKFGDFLFDQVVAPVRENVAQLLGCCVAIMTRPIAHQVIKLMLKMLKKSNWEIRHGGILGLKYSIGAVEQSFSKQILAENFDEIFSCLGDSVDDVSAEAAASLIPVKDLLIEATPEKVPKLVSFLWDHLADLDELTTSTSSIVLLLASLITSSLAQIEPSESIKSIPRLWALLGHSSTSVRISVMRALITLIESQKSSCLSWMAEDLIGMALRLVFQRSILENVDEVRPYIEQVWSLLIRIDNEDVKKAQLDRFNLLRHTSQCLNYWLCLVMQPSNVPIDRGSPMWLNISADGSRSETKPDCEVYIGSSTFNAESIDQQTLQVIKCRILGTRLLGNLYANLINDFSDSAESQHFKDTLNYLAEMFVHYLATKSANQRMFSGWTIESWASYLIKQCDPLKMSEILPSNLRNQLDSAIQDNFLYYDEMASTLTRLQQEAREFVSCATNAGLTLNVTTSTDKKTFYNFNQLQSLCDIDIESELTVSKAKQKPTAKSNSASSSCVGDKLITMLQAKQSCLRKSLESSNLEHKALSTSVLSSLAAAMVSWRIIPQKVKIVIDPLLDSIEMEGQPALQEKSVHYLVDLIDILSQSRNDASIIENTLVRLIRALSSRAFLEASEISFDQSSGIKSEDSTRRNSHDNFRIIQLDNLQRIAEMNRGSRRHSSVASVSSLKRSHSVTSTTTEPDTLAGSSLDQFNSIESSDVKLRGASMVLRQLASHFGESLAEKIPFFWNAITSDIKTQIKLHNTSGRAEQDDQKLIQRLKLLEVVGDNLSDGSRKELLELYPDLISLLDSPKPVIRHLICQCIRVISNLMLADVIDKVRDQIIPMLEQSTNVLARCGAIEAIALIIEHLHLKLLPYINMFIIPILRRTSDQNDQVRLMATHCFGKLLSLMPLNLCKSDLDGTNSTHESHYESSQADNVRFIEQLFDPRKLDNFKVRFDVKAELRGYQQDGLNWLAFLNRFNLHGILCDEMGLGKTLMTICMVASDHVKAITNTMELGENSDKAAIKCPPPSLIICPPTLTEHWLYEIEKFLPTSTKKLLNSIAYFGNINDRLSLRSHILSSLDSSDKGKTGGKSQPVSLIVTSYEMIRIDLDFFKSVHWNYCVLDEGHIIKNGKTKLSRSIRLLNAKHRLILSGTPIQNNVTELWSLFDFLMPGFLGSERQFNSRYAKPILLSREPKCSSREQEAGALAMEALHRQVLPFILRRLKEDVLDDLPPKIIQDYYCELSPLQLKLYEDFTNSNLCKNVTHKSVENLKEKSDEANSEIKTKSRSHVFQALQYLKNVCNHPKLVLKAKHPQYLEIKKSLQNDNSLDDISHSSKLKALKQLLLDCGIGVNQSGDDTQVTGNQQQQHQALTSSIESVVNQHRALIFCQVRSMVDIIENDLLAKHLPGVTYLKLDGSVPANQRLSIVSRFNNDPSIDILLLTTQIGGLGLNLTGADTVIFVEHNWNPTKDLQAIDRAHRIGQKKVVNVYRLITKGTLEEKIMGFQKFKTMVSNTVINQDNTGLGTMKVDQLLDLFESDQNMSSSNGSWREDVRRNSGASRKSSAAGSTASGSAFMELLPELWDQQQYETEYDLSNFVASLKN